MCLQLGEQRAVIFAVITFGGTELQVVVASERYCWWDFKQQIQSVRTLLPLDVAGYCLVMVTAMPLLLVNGKGLWSRPWRGCSAERINSLPEPSPPVAARSVPRARNV